MMYRDVHITYCHKILKGRTEIKHDWYCPRYHLCMMTILLWTDVSVCRFNLLSPRAKYRPKLWVNTWDHNACSENILEPGKVLVISRIYWWCQESVGDIDNILVILVLNMCLQIFARERQHFLVHFCDQNRFLFCLNLFLYHLTGNFIVDIL